MATFTNPYVCDRFLERVHSDVCHICLQPEGAHPTDDDAQYWAAWLVSELELVDWNYAEGAWT